MSGDNSGLGVAKGEESATGLGVGATSPALASTTNGACVSVSYFPVTGSR